METIVIIHRKVGRKIGGIGSLGGTDNFLWQDRETIHQSGLRLCGESGGCWRAAREMPAPRRGDRCGHTVKIEPVMQGSDIAEGIRRSPPQTGIEVALGGGVRNLDGGSRCGQDEWIGRIQRHAADHSEILTGSGIKVPQLIGPDPGGGNFIRHREAGAQRDGGVLQRQHLHAEGLLLIPPRPG